MGSGKTTVGRLLAEQLNWAFIDLDTSIRKRSGYTIHDLFRFYGEEDFRVLEASALYATTLKEETVIATGGGVPCYYDNMKVMKDHGMVIYLEGSPITLAQRLLAEGLNTRPLIKDKDPSELTSFIEKHLDKRLTYYQQAHFTFSIEPKPEEIVIGIIEKMVDL